MHLFYTRKWARIFADEQGYTVDGFELVKGDKIISYSFIKKEINRLPFAENVSESFFDITSPYAYGGIYVSKAARNDAGFINCFKDKFIDYCSKNNIVTEFVRFHPLQRNHIYFRSMYTLKHVNDNAFIDLKQSDDDIIKNIAKRHRYCIRKAIVRGVKIEFCGNLEKMPIFVKLYKQTNDKNKADRFYYFSAAFFEKLINDFGDKIRLVIASLDGKPVSASLFICDEKEVYYFLSGTNNLGYSVFACHLLLHEVIFWSKEEGYNFFNLGGGVKRNDNLFLFKSGFSDTIVPYYIGTAIRMRKKYNKFLRMSSVDQKIDYFPKYRYGF